jgi:hydrogenase nickel incorporation protein HypA/HybF
MNVVASKLSKGYDQCGSPRVDVRLWTFGTVRYSNSMHELGIAASILDCVQNEAERHAGVHISKVGIKVGELAGVDRDALQFGFDALVKDTEFEPLQLEIESVPRVQRCLQCEYEFRMTEFDPRCPLCGDFGTRCVNGEELDIAYMEVDE